MSPDFFINISTINIHLYPLVSERSMSPALPVIGQGSNCPFHQLLPLYCFQRWFENCSQVEKGYMPDIDRKTEFASFGCIRVKLQRVILFSGWPLLAGVSPSRQPVAIGTPWTRKRHKSTTRLLLITHALRQCLISKWRILHVKLSKLQYTIRV